MSELLENRKAKLCLEIEFDDENTLNELSFSAKTEVLGGKVTRVDFTGDVFNEVDMYRELFNGKQMAFLMEQKKWKKQVKEAIYYALAGLIKSIKLKQSSKF